MTSWTQLHYTKFVNIIITIRLDHHFAHTTTVYLSWFVRLYDLIAISPSPMFPSWPFDYVRLCGRDWFQLIHVKLQILVGYALFQWYNALQEIICKHNNAHQIVLVENCTHLSFADDRMSSYDTVWWPLHIETETRWPPISRRHFQLNFLELKWIFFINISLKFVPKGPIYNITALVQIMPWRQPGNKWSSVPLTVSLLQHISVTRPQWPEYEAQPWNE